MSLGLSGHLPAEAESVSTHKKPTATAPPVDPYKAAEKITEGNLGHPFVLPPASRARIHECGIEWQAMKMSGEATDKIWRVFATVCLAEPSDKARSAVAPNASDTTKQP